jgi:hypothetical protein
MKRSALPLAAAALVAGTLVAAPAAAAATPRVVQASYSCSIDSYGTVTADWLKVHTQPSVTSAAVGQIPYGNRFHYCSSSGRSNGGIYWIYGYGYNGSVKLTGWVDAAYVSHP